MPKNIVICCDGTNNQFAGHHTNVIRTYKVAVDGPTQVCFYDPGVGTMPEPWETTQLGKRWSMIKGLAFGSGFLDNIADAYRFLMENYEEDDQVFLFGFSRGAFTVRALAGMLHSVGLLLPGIDHLVPYALSYWQNDRGTGTPGGDLCLEFKSTLARPCPVHFIGVWDTVGSVGFFNHFKSFPYTYHNPEVAHVRHAVSVDERRCCFRQNLMGPDDSLPKQDIKNVWFAGVHSDVGGGYDPQESGLAKLTFKWMMREAQLFGLQIDPAALDHEVNQVGEKPNPLGTLHVSLTWAWWLIEFLPTQRYSFADHQKHWRLSLGSPRGVLRDAAQPFVYLHESVITRIKAGIDYRPKNLPLEETTLRSTFKIVA